MRALLDVNVLIALLDASRTLHERAHAWWNRNAACGWATCPLTENRVVRVMTNSAYSSSRRFDPSDVLKALAEFVSATDRRLTDLYLLALATENGGLMVSFDRGINASGLAKAGSEHFCLI